jgi:membrane-associated phospholipid phosphatase
MSERLTPAQRTLRAKLAAQVALVGWSRVSLGDHTPAQVTVGSMVGVLAGGLLYWALVNV